MNIVLHCSLIQISNLFYYLLCIIKYKTNTMARPKDEEDIGKYGERRYRSEKIVWSPLKVLFTLFLFGSGIALVITGIYPLLDMMIELKSFANLLFVVLIVFYMFSFQSVTKKSSFVFWSTTFSLFLAGAFLFFFYEEIFF